MRWRIHWCFGVLLMLSGLARSQAGSPTGLSPHGYSAIPERNAFGLNSTLPPSAPVATVEPIEDLVLNGLIEVATCREAVFMLVEPGKPPSFFTIREGEQNEWLEVKLVNSREGTVKLVLKKPVARLRTVGVEVMLSFETNDRKLRTTGLNRGNPHVDIPVNP